jgi:hypothetical protein
MSYFGSPRNGGSDYAQFDTTRYWAGTGATALVAALIAFVGYMVFKWTLHISVLTPLRDGAWGNAQFAVLVTAAAGGLLFLLTIGAPQPRTFFRWIMAVGTLASVVYPFSTTAKFSVMAATATINLMLGIAMLTLLSASAERATRQAVPAVAPAVPQQPRYGPNYIGSARGPRYGPGQYPGSQHGSVRLTDQAPTQPIRTTNGPPQAVPPDYGWDEEERTGH